MSLGRSADGHQSFGEQSVQHRMGVLIRLDGIIICCCFKLVYPFIPVCRMPENYRDNKRCHHPAKDQPPHNSTSWGKRFCQTASVAAHCSNPLPTPPHSRLSCGYLCLFLDISLRKLTLPLLAPAARWKTLNAANHRINGRPAPFMICGLPPTGLLRRRTHGPRPAKRTHVYVKPVNLRLPQPVIDAMNHGREADCHAHADQGRKEKTRDTEFLSGN